VILVADGTCDVDPSQEDEYREALKAISGWKPPVTEGTLAKWEEQIKQMNDKLSLGKLLQKYWTLSDKMVPFQDAVERQLGWLEIALESQRKP
jgi:hypothetical protein